MSGSILRYLVGRILRLPPRRHARICVERDITVPMRDRVVLLGNRHFPAGQEKGPVVLMRSPYGRGSLFGLMASLFAEQGLQVVVQSVRGTGGSGGQFNPMRQERCDGADTVDWVRAQPWFSGHLYTFGPSYLGNAQWAMASELPEALDGLALAVTLSNFHDELHSFGGFTLGGTLSWTQTMVQLIDAKPGKGMARPDPDGVRKVANHLPLGTMDQAATGRTVAWWQDWVNHDDPQDPWWQAIDHGGAVASLAAPTFMVGGWQDIFLPFQLRDFQVRQAAGREAWLTVGPWSHAAPGAMAEGLRQAIRAFAELSAGRTPNAGRDRVRLYVQGAKKWREYPSWPPPGNQELCYYLADGGQLATSAPSALGAARFVYDPSDPTPSVHGPKVMGGARRRNMRQLEDRSDAILFTSEPIDQACEVIGPVAVALSVRSEREHGDVYACLCDVDERGRSQQVSDGYLRLRPGEPAVDGSGVRRIVIHCWPTAYRFKRGHRFRLIIAGGAHPRYARNLGTGERAATATRMVPTHHEVLHGPDHRSALIMATVQGAHAC